MNKLDALESILEEIIKWSRFFGRVVDYRFAEPIKLSCKDFRLSIKLLAQTIKIRFKKLAIRANTSLKEDKTNPYVYRRSWIDRAIDITQVILLLVSVMMAISKPRKLIVLN